MITAVDTSILLDVFLPDKAFAADSSRLLKLAYDEARGVRISPQKMWGLGQHSMGLRCPGYEPT